MRTIQMQECSLTAAAAQLDQVAVTLAGALAQIRAHGCPDTGRDDTRALLEDVLERLGSSVRALGTAAALDADRLRSAASAYVVADGQVIR